MINQSLEHAGVKVDTYFGIGRSHDVNQDYALSGATPYPWVVVADGCSSSDHTDVGARLLAWSARRCLMDHKDILNGADVGMGDCIIQRAEKALAVLGDPESLAGSVLDATLMLAYVKAKRLVVHSYGDGVIALGRTDGSISVLEIDYSHNAPLYLSYRLDAGRAQQWRSISTHESKVLRQQGFSVSLDKERGIKLSYHTDNLAWVLLGTDGLQTFMSDLNKSQVNTIGAHDAVSTLTQFKNTNGQYLKRRVKRQLNIWAKQGIMHEDDLGLGCILFGERRYGII